MSKKLNFKKISIHTGPKQSPGFLLWHVSTSWRYSIETILKTFKLTHPQFVVLATTGWLTKNGELATQIMIGKMAGLDPNTTSQIIQGIEEKKLVSRSASSDGRAKNVSLTSMGSKILEQAIPAVEQTDAKFFSALTKEEISFLMNMVQKLLDFSHS